MATLEHLSISSSNIKLDRAKLGCHLYESQCHSAKLCKIKGSFVEDKWTCSET